MHLSEGTTIGPYRIERELGRGGMGIVYLARDTRLDRMVAIKALPDHLTADPDRLARFEREAKIVASLHHPGIAGVYALEKNDSGAYLVMELVEGETLAMRLERGALPLGEAVRAAISIADALDAAHEKGVVHRDLKPGNIMVTPDGGLKILDFGLARSDETAAASTSAHLLSQSPTLSTPVHSPTIPGVIMGTAGYMSPEQARGKAVDKRSDIFSFGVVVYEMLTGIKPFHGETVADAIGATLHKEVELDRLPPATPPGVRRILTRCLQRDKALRFRDIGDVRFELEHAGAPEDHTPGAAAKRPLLPIMVAAVALVLGAAGVVVGLRIAPRSALPVSVVCIDPPLDTRIQFSGDLAGPPVVSPDGTMIAFTAARSGERGRLWVRRLDEREAREIRDTDGALFPFWSPDSRSIGFFRTDALRKVDLESETLFTLCEVTQARGGTWLADGTIVFAPSFRSELFAIDADGGTPRPLAPMDPDLHSSHRWPQALPTPGQFLFIAVNAASRKRANNGVYIGSLDGSPPRRLLDTNYHAQFVDDRLLYVRDRVLLSTRVDLKKATIVGKSQVIARDIQGDLSTWHAQFSASAAGVLVYNQRPEETAAHGSADDRTGYSAGFEGDRISSFARDGRLSNTYAEGEPIVSMRLSPDGSTLVLSTLTRDGTTDLWLYPTGWLPDLSTPEAIDRLKSLVKLLEPKRLTFRKGPESRPIWSPDGTEVAFYWVGDADEGEGAGIYRQRIGDGTSTRIYERDANNGYPAEWTPDGKHVLMVTGGWLTAMDNDIWAIPAEGGKPFPIVETPGFDGAPAVSPDGRWLAYASGSVGNVDVFVIPFPPAWPEGTPSRKWQVSMNGGIAPRWSSDGKELYYITTEGVLVAVETDISGETIAYSAPVALFQSPWDVGASYDVTPRGENDQSRFMFVDLRQPDDEPIAVILGWQRLAE